jgi:predicted glycosyltransferase
MFLLSAKSMGSASADPVHTGTRVTANQQPMTSQHTAPQLTTHKALPANAVSTHPSQGKRIWIDLDNSPHVPFFAPIISELERRGYSVVLTARDCFQVCALADLHNFRYQRVGRHYGKHKALKAFGTCLRAVQLAPYAWRERPDLAVSHGSRSQLICGKLARIPTVVICDYEFAEPVPGVAPTWVIVPEVIPDTTVRFGDRCVLKYPGIKEDVYASGLNPDPSVMAEFGIDQEDTIVTLRPPASEAHYRSPESDKLLDATLRRLSHLTGVRIISLPRNDKQAFVLRKTWPDLFSSGKMMIPKGAVDGLNLIWHSDLVIGGGGTMNREAAALGVPVYSIFRGNIGAVDRYLAASGRLVLLESVSDVQNKLIVARRSRTPRAHMSASGALERIVEHLTGILDAGDEGRIHN